MSKEEQVWSELNEALKNISMSSSAFKVMADREAFVSNLTIVDALGYSKKTISDRLGIPYSTLTKYPFQSVSELYKYVKDERPNYTKRVRKFILEEAEIQKQPTRRVLKKNTDYNI
jgi:predicted transcriptional regulator